MALEREYDAKQVEAKWQKYWADNGIFRFRPDSGKPVYSIDTPPPTVSGKLHIGHVFSY
ncbi:MAG TPA: class I tRNA ligase family protein, partial [Candidatus Aminicenantes bacterium]|nr:class I tRNA ligase family protein [Candidatus Aminicenantes bacterium]